MLQVNIYQLRIQGGGGKGAMAPPLSLLKLVMFLGHPPLTMLDPMLYIYWKISLIQETYDVTQSHFPHKFTNQICGTFQLLGVVNQT